MRNPVIYRIISPTNKIYIGQTWDIINRLGNYRNIECKYQTKIYNSLRKYGFENHKFEIVREFSMGISQLLLDEYEKYYWNCYKDGGFEMLNIREPGRGGKLAEETKLKMSISRKGRKHTEESNKKRSESNKGKKRSQYTRDRMSANRPKGGDAFNANAVMNTATGEIWPTIKQCAEANDINRNTLSGRLHGHLKNETSFKLLKNI